MCSKKEEVLQDESHNSCKEFGNDKLILNNTLSVAECVSFAQKAGVSSVKIVLSGCNVPIPTYKSYLLKTEIRNLLNGVSGITSMEVIKRTGEVILCVNNPQSAQKLASIKELRRVEVQARFIEDTICSKFLFKDLCTDVTLEELAEQLNKQNIKWYQLVRFTMRKTSEKAPIVLLKELGKVNRDEIDIWGIGWHVSTYIKYPKICPKCLQFNHLYYKCRNNPRCAMCGEGHKTQNCSMVTPRCFRCGEEHTADYKRCPVVAEEVEIRDLVSKENIPYKIAKRIIRSKNILDNNETERQRIERERAYREIQQRMDIIDDLAVLNEFDEHKKRNFGLL